ncbi:MAG: hypothetical protein HQM08_19485 [Candidatus Riflebacteria bacterium]|nr:hypothetical protein [Candidatus Riflebacteria bacterium]
MKGFLEKTKISGLSLLEIVIVMFCFAIAAIPIVRIFSINIEGTRAIQTKLLSYLSAQEIIGQIALFPPDKLPAQCFALSGQLQRIRETEPVMDLHLSPLPESFSRSFRIEESEQNHDSKITVLSLFRFEVSTGIQSMQIRRNFSSNDGGR